MRRSSIFSVWVIQFGFEFEEKFVIVDDSSIENIPHIVLVI